MYKEGKIEVYGPGEEIPSIENLLNLGLVKKETEYRGASIADAAYYLQVDRRLLREDLIRKASEIGGNILRIDQINERVGIVTYVLNGRGTAFKSLPNQQIN